MAQSKLQRLWNLQSEVMRWASQSYEAERAYRKDSTDCHAKRWKDLRLKAISAMNKLEAYRREKWPKEETK